MYITHFYFWPSFKSSLIFYYFPCLPPPFPSLCLPQTPQQLLQQRSQKHSKHKSQKLAHTDFERERERERERTFHVIISSLSSWTGSEINNLCFFVFVWVALVFSYLIVNYYCLIILSLNLLYDSWPNIYFFPYKHSKTQIQNQRARERERERERETGGEREREREREGEGNGQFIWVLSFRWEASISSKRWRFDRGQNAIGL